MSRFVTVARQLETRIVRNMAHAFQRVDLIVALKTGQFGWAWFESETDDYTGCMLMLKLRMLLTLPGRGFSELIFVDSNRDAN